MRNWYKKIISSIGIIIITSIPIIFLLSCGGSKKDIPNKVNYHRPFQFEELKEVGKNQPIMGQGISNFAYSHGMSFIVNVFRKLGFNLFEEDARVENEKIINIKYYLKNIQKDIKDKKIIKQEEQEKYIKNQKDHAKQVFHLFNENKENAKNEGTFSSYSIHSDAAGIRGYLHDHIIWANGIIQEYIFTNNENNKYEFILKNIKDKNDKKYNIKTKMKNNKLLKNINTLTWGMPKFYDIFDGNQPGKKILGFEVGNYDESNDYYANKIFGSNKINMKKRWSFTYSLVSAKSWTQTYNIIDKNLDQNKINEIKMLTKAMIKNLYLHVKNININNVENDTTNKAIMIMHPTIIRMFNFVKNLNIQNPKILENIDKAVEELNNGSHSLFGFELFARGIEGLPVKYASRGFGTNVPDNGTIDLIGIINSNNKWNLLYWYGIKSEKNGKGFDPNTMTSIEHFDPHTMIPIVEEQKNKNDIEVSIKRPGVTIREMGGLVNRKVYKRWWKENRDIYIKWLDDMSKWIVSSESPKPVLEYKTKLKFIDN